MIFRRSYSVVTYLLTYLLIYLLTYLLTPWSRVLLEKLTSKYTESIGQSQNTAVFCDCPILSIYFLSTQRG